MLMKRMVQAFKDGQGLCCHLTDINDTNMINNYLVGRNKL